MSRTKFAGLMATPKTPARRPSAAEERDHAPSSTTERRRRGGRSSNPEQFRQMLVYVDVPTLDAFKVQLAKEKLQASVVISELMRSWLGHSAPPPPPVTLTRAARALTSPRK